MAVPLYFSHSQLAMYSRCPLQYKRRYVDGRKDPPGIALVDGSAYHKALERGNLEMIAKRTPTGKQLVEYHAEALEELANKEREGLVVEPREWDQAHKTAKKLLPDYASRVQGKVVKPVAAERKFETRVVGRDFLGVIDVVNQDGSFYDYKTSGRKKSEKIVASSTQLHIYAHVQGTLNTGHIQLVKSGIPEVIYTPVTLSQAQIERSLVWAARVMDAIDNSMRTNEWAPCPPDSWHCDRRFCGYYDLCYGPAARRKVMEMEVAND